MLLRKGKTKLFLESSIDCALLAVEIYNKPRATFRVEGFITHMIMAWTRLLQSYFNQTIGETYFYKEKGRYKKIDGERKAWELKTCIQKYEKLTEPVKTNLDFFIKLRNKIEHRIVDKEDIGISIFGECQSLLYNYENELIKIFGIEYALNESLAFSLQFSKLRTIKQTESSKQLLSSEYKEIKDFIQKYRENLRDDIFNTQEYSIKLIQVPKISNTGRNDLAIEFVNWSSLSEEDRKKFDNLITIVKDKIIRTEAINYGKLKPSTVVKKVKEEITLDFNLTDHKHILVIFKIRPYTKIGDNHDPFETNTKYCHYDEAHKDYLYKASWVEFLIFNIKSGRLNKEFWKKTYDERKTIDIRDYEIIRNGMN